MIFDKGLNGTTWANQIASAAIITSPLLTFAANPKTILSNPARQMIESIPSTWDETIVLPSSAIGQIAAFARRKGNTWFVAVDNGMTPRRLKISLSFLDKGNYHAYLVSDVAGNPAAVKIQNTEMNKSGFLDLDLQNGGGFIGSFAPFHSKP
jgi:alpha-glucosidase